MNNQENTRKNIFWNYYNIKSSLENHLRNIHIDTRKIFNEGVQDIVFRLQLSMNRNQEKIEQSMDELYLDVKNAFGSIFNYNWSNSSNNNSDKNVSYSLIYPSYQGKKEKRFLEIEDASFFEDNIKNKNNYTYLVNNLISKSSSIINNIAKVMAGKLCNSYGIKDRKPKRLWKWDDRIDYLQSYLKENKLSSVEQDQIKELRHALRKNKYLKSKRKDCYKKIDDCLAQYYS